jgi:hypothetical protein
MRITSRGCFSTKSATLSSDLRKWTSVSLIVWVSCAGFILTPILSYVKNLQEYGIITSFVVKSRILSMIYTISEFDG